MAEPTPNGDEHVERRIMVLGFPGDRVRVALSDGLPLDIAERMLYGALKFLERELAVLRLRQVLAEPRIEIPRGSLLPPGPGRG